MESVYQNIKQLRCDFYDAQSKCIYRETVSTAQQTFLVYGLTTSSPCDKHAVCNKL